MRNKGERSKHMCSLGKLERIIYIVLTKSISYGIFMEGSFLTLNLLEMRHTFIIWSST